MSATAQTNGKKSSNSSAVNTPASTPVTNGNSQMPQSTPPPPNNNAPKYGTLVPNRIFVGGISANTTEGELLQLFSNYGTVKAAKIIQDRAGVSKGYGFITFESEDDAKRPLKDADNIVLRERKLNIAPAIKKQPFNRAFDASSPSTVPPGNTAQYFFPPSAGVPYFQGGVTYYQQPPAAPGDPNSQPATVYQAPPVYPTQTGPPQGPTYSPMMFPPHIYMPQQYAMPPMPYDYNYYPNNGAPQYMVGGGQNNPPSSGSSSAPSSQAPPMPPSNSPPRPPPCYNNQLPPYAADPLYYNMPVYGAPLDGTAPVYPPETMDMANNGYPEVSQHFGDFLAAFDGLDVQGSAYPPPEQDLDHHHHNNHHHPIPSHDDDDRQQTKTPVVSILSMEQHQEKDFVSMQGGRRVKLQPPPPPPPALFPFQFRSQPQQQQQPPQQQFQFKSQAVNGWRKPRNYGAPSRSDSNSSANAAEEDAASGHPHAHAHNGNRTYENSVRRKEYNKPSNNKSNFVVYSAQVRNGQQGYVVGNSASAAAAAARRNKRSGRRSGQTLSEIGAGDAPLPADVAETCKKMETLKM